MAKVGDVGCGGAVIKHTVNCFPIKGFWGAVPTIYAAPNSLTWYMGRYLGFHPTPAHVAY